MIESRLASTTESVVYRQHSTLSLHDKQTDSSMYPGSLARVTCGLTLAAILLLLNAPCLWATTIHPQLVEAHITNPDMIYELSKFRSGAGHDFSYDPSFAYAGEYFGATDSTEPDSSMKHYYVPYLAYKGDQLTVPVFAPFDGTFTRVTEEVHPDDATKINKRIELTSADDSDYIAVLFHLNLDHDYPQILNDWPAALWPAHQPDDSSYLTDTVSAGDFLGYADMRISNDFDVAILYEVSAMEKYWISLYDLMPNSLFESYQNRGASRAAMSFTKSERLADPVTWWGGRNDEDWLTLNQVPERSTLSLSLCGLLVLLLMRRYPPRF